MQFSAENHAELEQLNFSMLQLEDADNNIDEHRLVAAQQVVPGNVQQKFCGIYQVAKPVLQIVAGLFFIPVKIRNTITTLMVAADAVCANSAPQQ
jgi:hypothetical protein